MTEYISTSDAARRNNISASLVKRLAQQGRIPGAYLLNARAWAIPADWRHSPAPSGNPNFKRQN